ncbi:MAG: hypothetical protein AAB368_00665, partial [bacterium]
TVELGPGYMQITPTVYEPGIKDIASCGGGAGYGVSDSATKTIRYIKKEVDKDIAAPGDTLTYKIYYSKPGPAATLTTLTILDTMPAYMHLLSSTSMSTPDPGWDPDPGPPMRLRWTMTNVPALGSGGGTGVLTFQTTVDWGNGESFEPGSGDVGAPEGTFMFNNAQMTYTPNAGCPNAVSNSVTTVAKRYLFWLVGDNDVLFGSKPGMPDDEIIYELFVRNISNSKTWWSVKLWDTVPAEVDPWAVNMGFNDPCMGWTMSPTGCAAAAPGRLVVGGNTLLTWGLDLPPAATLVVQWKAKLRTTITPGTNVINKASMIALGSPFKIGGSGAAVNTRNFNHEAAVVLRTTFISYVGFAGDDSAWFGGCPNW